MRVTYSFCPRLSSPSYGSLFRQSSSVYGSWPRQSSPVNCSCPGPILYSRMLCEGSPLLFYTPWGPVTPMGMYRGARRLSQQTGERTGELRRANRGAQVRVSYSFCRRLSCPVYGSWPRQSSPVYGSCPGHILYSRMLCEGSPLLFYTPWGPVTPMGMYRRARRLRQRTGDGPARVTYSFFPRLSRPVCGSLPRQSSSSPFISGHI